MQQSVKSGNPLSPTVVHMADAKSGRSLMIRLVKSELTQLWGNLLFDALQRFSFHLTPVHYYEPIPDTRTLRDSLWERSSSLVGVDLGEQRQIALLSELASRYRGEYDSTPRRQTSVPHEYFLENKSYIGVDGEMLYSMIRRFKPRRMIEIGSGMSTLMSSRAVLKNREETGNACEYTVFDPYPNDVIKGGVPGLSRVVETGAEDVGIEEFSKLKENDILFIDSSHVLRIGNDVQYLYLDVLPRLSKGVVVHVHDVFLPAEYPREWVMKDHFFWNEQYLLQSFLTLNDSFRVLWASHFMHLAHSDLLSASFSSYDKTKIRPCSLWMQRVK